MAALTLAVQVMLTNTAAAQGRGGAGQQGAGGQGGRGGRGAAAPSLTSTDTDTRAYDKRDFTGVWAKGNCPECGEQFVSAGRVATADVVRVPGYGYFGDVPPMTDAGMKRLLATKHGRGFEPNSAGAKTPGLHIAYRRAGLPAFSNDPEAACEMMGAARSTVMSGPDSTMEMFHSKDGDRIVHRTEWYWENRDLWLDGRAVPKPGSQTPRVTGYSTGRWEGDVLVVTTTGFDDRQWVDMYGFPISENAILTERWERISPNRLRAVLTLNDPENYKGPWTSSAKTWALIPKEQTKIEGWAALVDNRCIPSDEALFNNARDHAAGVGDKK
jgi:hypothetical protein